MSTLDLDPCPRCKRKRGAVWSGHCSIIGGTDCIRAQRDALLAEVEQLRARVVSEPHCPTCHCARRAPVQGDSGSHLPIGHSARPKDAHGPGSIEWEEHLHVWSLYAAKYGDEQSAERLAQRGGFSYGEIVSLIGMPPKSWRPIGADRG